jgi:hypothetical protein
MICIKRVKRILEGQDNHQRATQEASSHPFEEVYTLAQSQTYFVEKQKSSRNIILKSNTEN